MDRARPTDEPAPAGPVRGFGRLEATVHGLVQGVGYRAFVRARAVALGLRGHARNNADGTVSVVAEGETDALYRLVEALRQGPPAGRVESLEIQWDEPRGMAPGFGIG